MAEQLVDNLGLFGLFVAAFAAASLLPFPVEAAVPVLVELGHSTAGIVIVGTAGGYLGSLINYRLASHGERWWRDRHPKRVALLERVQRAFARLGAVVLLFSWLPIVGEVITVAAGVARVRLAVFSLWTIVGRAVRMLALVGLSLWIF